jgi:CubicO group peptidase (beta-lactamase class C family)
MSTVASIRDRLNDVLNSRSADLRVAGAVAGVDVGGERVAVARGCANLNTGQEFTQDTGFLFGSVTKLLTATVLMRLVDRRAIDLDEPVLRYVPEFTLRDPDGARQVTVRMLINHTNGIDANWLAPDGVRGRDASRSYTAELHRVGLLFEPGSFIHYSNAGFVLAARAIEEATGLPFERAIRDELFLPCGMLESTAVQTEAFLRRTAIGAFADPETEGLRATRMFSRPESNAGGGSTTIGTVKDMLTFGRMHLSKGMAANGACVLSSEAVNLMQTQTFDIGLPGTPPIGLGWWLVPVAGTTAAWHAGGSPGGTASFCILPEYDAVVVSFVAGADGGAMNDLLHNAAIEELTRETVTPAFALESTQAADEICGDYEAFVVRKHIEKDGDLLVVTTWFEPYDDEILPMMSGFGVVLTPTAVAYASVSPGLFAPVGIDFSALGGFYARFGLLTALPAAPGRRAGIHHNLCYVPKIA